MSTSYEWFKYRKAAPYRRLITRLSAYFSAIRSLPVIKAELDKIVSQEQSLHGGAQQSADAGSPFFSYNFFAKNINKDNEFSPDFKLAY